LGSNWFTTFYCGYRG